MKFILLLVCIGLVAALDDLSEGIGTCSVCKQTDQVVTCCSGNTLCVSDEATPLKCDQTIGIRDDTVPASREISRALYTYGTSDFCSVCCGLDSESNRCCSATKSCTCTKNYYPSCV